MDQETKIITFMNPASPYAEAYKKLQLDIQFSSMEKNIQVIQLTSTQASEGKTSTAINLAAVYALKNKKVIVIDLDFRKPKVHHVLKLKNRKGIVDILVGNEKFEDVVYKHESGVEFLVSGSKTSKIELTLESERLAKFINELRSQYDIIILDCPPAIAVTDASLISRLSDGVVFVIAYNHTKKDIVKESIKRLKLAGANILGIVMSQVDMNIKNYYYDSKYYYSNNENEEGGNA